MTDCPATDSEPVRAPPVFGNAVNVTVPVPLPLEPDVIVSQLVVVLAVQGQPEAADTLTDGPTPPTGDTDIVVGATTYEQPVLCETVIVWPATVRAPVLAGPVFAATVKAVEPVPVPLAPDVTVIHVTVLIAVHAHPAALVTFSTGPLPPAASIEALVGLTVYEQLPAWVMVTVWPPTVSVPVRAAPLFAATRKVTVPLPVPLSPDVTVSQDAPLVAVHAHPLAAVTLSVGPVPPVAGTDAVEGFTLIEQLPSCVTVIV